MAERRLNPLFANAVVTPDTVHEVAHVAGQAQAAMRSAHLVAYTFTGAPLSEAQLSRYENLWDYRPG